MKTVAFLAACMFLMGCTPAQKEIDNIPFGATFEQMNSDGKFNGLESSTDTRVPQASSSYLVRETADPNVFARMYTFKNQRLVKYGCIYHPDGTSYSTLIDRLTSVYGDKYSRMPVHNGEQITWEVPSHYVAAYFVGQYKGFEVIKDM